MLLAQSTTTGAISGIVTDPTGAVLPGISVNMKSTERGFTQVAKTNAQGFYQFSLVEPGVYTITISAPSFKTTSSTTTVSVDQNTIINARLELGSAATTVEVSGEAPLLQTESSEIATTFNQREISEVPNGGNDLSFIAQTAAGSVMNTGSGYGNFSSFGLSASSNLFTLNGMYDNDPFLNLNNSGATNLLLGQNEVSEATVVTNGYSGQFGGFVGANINYITKSGSNNWHGNANYWWNGRVMNANDYFHTDNSNSANNLPRGFVNANQYAGSFGGPIIKNKAYFFWNYEGLRVIIPVTNNGVLAPTAGFETAITNNLTNVGFGESIPFYNKAFAIWNNAPGYSTATPGSPGAADPTGCQGSVFTDPVTKIMYGAGTGNNCTQSFSNTVGNFTHEYLTAGRFDFNITNNDKIFVRLQEDVGTQATATDALNPVFNSTSYQPEYQAQIGWNRSIGAKAANNLLASLQYYRAIFGPANLPAALQAFPTTLLMNDGSLATVGGIDEAWPQGRNVTGYQLVDDLSYILNSKHTLKLGMNFHRNDLSDHDMGSLTSGLDIPLALATLYNPNAFGTGNQGVFEQSFPQSLNQPIKLYQLGWYVQDEWKPRSDLKLTFALRGDHNELPVCNTNCFARLAGPVSSILTQGAATPYNQAITTGLSNMAPSFTSVSWQPRFGFAWSPSWAKNTVFRGGIGIFMDTFQGSVADNLIENTPLDNTFGFFFGNIAQNENTNGNVFATAAGSNAALVSGFKAGDNLAALETATGGLFSPPGFTTIGNIVAPTTTEWNFEVQHSFGNNTSIIVNYVGSHGIHETMGFNGVNGVCPPTPNTLTDSTGGTFTYTRCAGGFPGLPSAQQAGGLGFAGWDGRFGTVNDIRTVGTSSYNGLSLSLQHRFAHGLQMQANYLYGHALDEVSNGGLNPFIFNGFGNSVLNPMGATNIRQFSYGNADYDVRHSLNANYVYELPKGPTVALKGWQLSGTVFFRTGLPYTAINGSAAAFLSGNGYGGPIFASYNGSGFPGCSGPSGALDTGINPCIPTASFPDFNRTAVASDGGTVTVPADYQTTTGIYNQRRNQFFGPHYFDTDMTLMKYTQIPHWESAKFGIGVQFFNLFNHPNFAAPVNDINSPHFGQVRSTVNPPTSILGSFLGGDASTRLIQLTGKFNF
jgi:hypothetical protein